MKSLFISEKLVHIVNQHNFFIKNRKNVIKKLCNFVKSM